MKHIAFEETPLMQLNYFSRKFNCNIICKRDDLFLSGGGGSKSRMLQYILYPILQQNISTIITAGGPCSNFNRALALLCAQYNINLRLVSYTETPEEYNNSLNHFIVKLTNTDLIFCKKNEVVETINKELDICSKQAISNKYIYGGGKSLEGIYAYFEAVKNLRAQYTKPINEVYVACGTGTTLTGICAGMNAFFPNAAVHAISVARDFSTEKEVLSEDMEILNDYLGSSYNFNNLVFHEEFLAGGYGHTDPDQLSTIQECISQEGLLVDPTYSGKAFWGMTKLLEKKSRNNKTILFWNTGAIFNLLSQKNEFQNL